MTGPLSALTTQFSTTVVPDAFYDALNGLIMKYGRDDEARVPCHEYDALFTEHKLPVNGHIIVLDAYKKAGWRVEFTTVQTAANEYACEATFSRAHLPSFSTSQL